MASSSSNGSDQDQANPRVEAAAKALGESLKLSASDALNAATLADKALKEISSKKAVFALRDWEKTLSAAGGQHWLGDPRWGSMRALIARQIGLIALSEKQLNNPWAMYSSEHLIRLESEMIELALRETDDHPIPQELMDAAFASRPTMAEEQRNATIASCTGRRSVVVTEGTAGAGKSFTLNAIREIYELAPPRPDHPDEEVGYDIIGTALSWTATKVLEASAGLKGGKAISGLCIAMDKAKEKGEDFFKRRTILIVDEAGLVDLYHMHKILWHAAHSEHPVRVMLTGDSLQLNPVQAGNALEAIVDACGSARLDTIRRQKQESHRNAVKHFCYGRAENALWSYWQQEAVHFCANADERREKVMRDYVRYMVAFPQKQALVLALENKEVARLNDEIRTRLKQVGRLVGAEHSIAVTDGTRCFEAKFCVGDQIVLRKNNVEHPVFASQFAKLHEGIAHAHEKNLASPGSAPAAPSAPPFKSILSLWKKDRSASQSGAGSDAPPTGEEVRKGVFNRMGGIILDIRRHPEDPKHRILRILLAEGGEIDIDTSVYKQGKSQEAKAEEEAAKKTGAKIKADPMESAVPITHNFATTIYASQGQTVERVFIMDSSNMNRRLAYVGMSRHTELCDIYLDCSQIAQRIEMAAARAKTGSFQPAPLLSEAEQATRAEAIREQLSGWTPKLGMTPSDYLQAAAKNWNTTSENPTVGMAKKQMKEKSAKAAKKGANAFRPELCLDDNPDDHPKERFEEPTAFEDMLAAYGGSSKELAREAAAKSSEAAKSTGFFTSFLRSKPVPKPEPIEAPAPVPAPTAGPQEPLLDSRESKELPDWASSPAAAAAFSALEGKAYGLNRFGYPRLFSVDPVKGYARSRWSLDGELRAGDGEIPVLANEAHFKEAPWFVVQGSREALISWGHFREKHAENPHKAPNIAIAFPAANLASLDKWVKPGSHALYCAWSPKDPSSLDKALALAEKLSALGHTAKVYPKPPESAVKPGAKP